MIDTYLQPEVHIVITQVPGVDGIASSVRLAQIEADLATVIARPEILGLGDVPGVDASGDAGMALLIQEDGSFAFGTQSTGINLSNSPPGGAGWETVYDETFRLIPDNDYGIRADASGDEGIVYLRLRWGGSGSSTTVSRSDHRHALPTPVRVTTAPSGYMSSGTRSLGSTSVTLADGIPYVVEAELYGQLRGADPGPAYYTLSINIGGNTFTSPGGESGFWCVQGVPDKINWEHERRMTGTGASVAVSASVAFHSGSGFNVDRTYLKVRLRPER